MLPLPLGLMRVLDLTSSRAGALATRMLGDLGAQVIRVDRPSIVRDDSDAIDCSKLSLALDVATPQGREVCLKLIAVSNFIFIEADGAVIDYEAIAAVRPSAMVIALHSDTAEVGLTAAGAAFTALFHHRETGQGQRIDVEPGAVASNLRSVAVVAAGLKASPAAPRQSAATAGTEPVARETGDVAEILSLPYRLSRTPVHVRLPAPRAGEHTDYVLRELLGLGSAEVESLQSAGIVAGVRTEAQ